MRTKLFLMFSSEILPKYDCITSMIFKRNSKTIAAFTFCLVTAANHILALCANRKISRFVWSYKRTSYLYVKEGCACYIGDRRAYLLSCVYYIYTKCINCISTDVITIYSGYQDFTFVVVHKQAPNHFENVVCLLLYYKTNDIFLGWFLFLHRNLYTQSITVAFTNSFVLRLLRTTNNLPTTGIKADAFFNPFLLVYPLIFNFFLRQRRPFMPHRLLFFKRLFLS